MREHLYRNLHLRLNLQFRAQVAHTDNQILQDRHLSLCLEIELSFIRLRISCQRNRLERRLSFVHRLPDLFRDERHHGMQQPQRGIE